MRKDFIRGMCLGEKMRGLKKIASHQTVMTGLTPSEREETKVE